MSQAAIGGKVASLSGVERYAKQLFEFLGKVQKNPNGFLRDQRLRESLRSQAALAALKIDEEDIRPCALNTLKKSATLVLDGGFAELDSLRTAVSETLEQAENSEAHPRETKAEYKRRLAYAEGRIKQLQEDLWQVSRAFHKAMLNARAYAADSKRADLLQRCAEDERELRCMVSLAQNKFSPELGGMKHGR